MVTHLARRPARDDRGATAVEYALIVAGIAIALVAVIALVGTRLSGPFTAAADGLSGGQVVAMGQSPEAAAEQAAAEQAAAEQAAAEQAAAEQALREAEEKAAEEQAAAEQAAAEQALREAEEKAAAEQAAAEAAAKAEQEAAQSAKSCPGSTSAKGADKAATCDTATGEWRCESGYELTQSGKSHIWMCKKTK